MTPLHSSEKFFGLLRASYERLVGKPLVPPDLSLTEGTRWLYEEAPFGILAHDTAPDPVFVYGNLAAQKRFEYGWEELTSLPSRLSAEAPERREREDFLRQVAERGFVSNYRGMRISKSGHRFWIEGVTVWQLIDEAGKHHGQAALLP